MKIKLDFSLYKGITKLRKWWIEVMKHLTQLQDAHNDLDEAVKTESEYRINADIALGERITQESQNCVSGDIALDERITRECETLTKQIGDAAAQIRKDTSENLQAASAAEAAAREAKDAELARDILTEAAARSNADNTLGDRLTTLEGKSHNHGNKSVIDGITADDVEKWNGIKEQVTQSQLDAAIADEARERNNAVASEAEARESADNGIIASFTEYISYVSDIIHGLTDEIKRLYTAIGVNIFDGGLFTQALGGDSLDGGTFEDADLSLFDCGGFEPLSIGINTNTVTDGGTY